MAEIAHRVARTRAEPPLVPSFLPIGRDGGGPKTGARQTAAASFVDELYASVLEPQRLAFALTCFARAFDAAEAWMIAHDAAADVRLVERSMTDAAKRTSDLMRALAETIAGWPGEHPGGVRAGTVDPRAIACGGENYLAVTAEVPGQRAVSLVALRSLPFSESEREAALALVADIRRALALRSRAQTDGGIGDGLRMFENASVALFVTRDRRIERSNAAASALVAEGRPVALTGGKLRLDDSRAQAAFEAISRADPSAQGRETFAFVVEGVAGRTWIAQLSLARPATRSNGRAPAVVVALTPFSGASETREAMLAGFTELTPTERAIFAAVVDGEDVAGIAGRMGRSVETVRWHVRNLFTKLGVNSQADLARLGALLLPI